MKNRCKNINDKNYGGRGITVCPQWLDGFKPFYDWAMNNGYQEGLSIDRTDNEGHYTPDNCKWSTTQEQNLNQRLKSSNKSGYRNVYYNKISKKWVAKLRLDYKDHYIGCYSTAEEAAIAYNLFVVLNDLPNKLNII